MILSYDDITIRYIRWLLHLIRLDFCEYESVITILYHTDFYYIVQNDIRRALDGIRLRDTFCQEEGVDSLSNRPEIRDFIEKPCSVLEALIALAIRLDDEWIGNPEEPSPDRWFLIFLDNLHILVRDVDLTKSMIPQIKAKITKWLNRSFSYNGKGSIFPLNQNMYDEDQRREELWTQMMTWIGENEHLWN